MPFEPQQKSCFQLKGSLFTLTVLQLFHNDLQCLKKELSEKVTLAPNFFNHTPVVIDLHELNEGKDGIDFKALKKIICSLGMIPVGVKGANEAQKEALNLAGLAILAEAKSAHKKSKPKPETEVQSKTKEDTSSTKENTDESKEIIKETITKTVEVNIPQKSKIITQNVRSGQQIYAPDGDLIIMGSVSAGAEVLADGNIHVYGNLRGRALAGIKGNQESAIFCSSLQSELISIAGIYLLCDDIPSENIGLSNYIKLHQEKLNFKLLIHST